MSKEPKIRTNYYEKHAIKLRKFDLNPREELIKDNITLVKELCQKYPDYDCDDLRSVGSIGLIKAASDCAEGKFPRSEFAEQARKKIELEILTYIRSR